MVNTELSLETRLEIERNIKIQALTSLNLANLFSIPTHYSDMNRKTGEIIVRTYLEKYLANLDKESLFVELQKLPKNSSDQDYNHIIELFRKHEYEISYARDKVMGFLSHEFYLKFVSTATYEVDWVKFAHFLKENQIISS